jgi:hypothetical protein
MNLTIWRASDLDERYVLLQKQESAFAVCRLLGGHTESAEDSIAAELHAWWNASVPENISASSVLGTLCEAAHAYSDSARLYAAAVVGVCDPKNVQISHFGAFLSLYRNGRKVAGGKEHTIDWKTSLYDDVPLDGDLGSLLGRVHDFKVPREDDEFFVGTPFLDCYACEADLAYLRADRRKVQDKLFSFGDRLIEKADGLQRSPDVFDPPRYKRDRLIAVMRID